jgi:N-acetylmuramoyl-L-alanine amidase
LATQTERVVGIRTGAHGDTLRVVLDLEGSPTLSMKAVEGSDNWEIVVKGACTAELPPDMTPSVCLLSIESACDGKDLRILLRAARPLVESAFRLPARQDKPERYVIDLRPAMGPVGKTTSPDSPAAAPPPSKPGASSSAVHASPDEVPIEGREASPQSSEPEPAPRRKGNWRILIDPGHGGDDPGARRPGIQEKEVVLDVARRVAKALNGAQGFEARLSRDDDRRIPLRQRMVLAEKYEADAFVSIHVNAAKAKKAMGVEVFFLSMGGASDEASRELALLENEVDPDYVVQEDSLLQGIPFSFDLRQSDTLMRSSRLAESVLMNFESSNLAASRGVKQAGFAVLKSFQVPSVLIEIGFLSNPAEAKRLKDSKHRQRLADCIVSGTIAYFERFARAKGEGE